MAATGTWTGTTDGDYSDTTNWAEAAVPTTATDVRIQPTTTVPINIALDQSAVAIADFIVEDGAASVIGIDASQTYLQIDPNRFEFAGVGIAYIDISAAAIDVEVSRTASAATGKRGLYLKGSAIATLDVNGKNAKVGLAFFNGETSTVTTARCFDGDLVLGAGVTLTTAEAHGGSVVCRCAATTLNVYQGQLTLQEVGAVTTINVYGGKVDLQGSGTVTNLNLFGGFTKVDPSQTCTNITLHPGASLEALPATISAATWGTPNAPIKYSTSRP